MSVTSEASTAWKGSLMGGSGTVALDTSHAGTFDVNWKARSEGVDTTAAVTFVPGTGITGSHLNVNAVVPGLSAEDFAKIAQDAKTGCPVSQALAGIEITLEATLA